MVRFVVMVKVMVRGRFKVMFTVKGMVMVMVKVMVMVNLTIRRYMEDFMNLDREYLEPLPKEALIQMILKFREDARDRENKLIEAAFYYGTRSAICYGQSVNDEDIYESAGVERL